MSNTPKKKPPPPPLLPAELVQSLRVRLALEVRMHQRSVEHWQKVPHRLSAAQAGANLAFAQTALERLNLTHPPTAEETAEIEAELAKVKVVKAQAPVVNPTPQANPKP